MSAVRAEAGKTADIVSTAPVIYPENVVSRHFDKAAQSYQSGARLQQQVALDLLARMPAALMQQGRLLDMGCGPGWLHPQLKNYCSELWAADLSAQMLVEARTQGLANRYFQADAALLPLPEHCLDVIFSSLMLQWCPKPAAVFAEFARVLNHEGSFYLTTLVTGSMAEFSQSWGQVDNHPHQLAFLSAAEVLDAATTQGFVCQSQLRTYQLFYPDVISLSRSFKQIGANYVAGRQGAGLGGKERWLQFAKAYEQYRTEQGLPLSYQVLQMVATKKTNSGLFEKL